MRRKKQKTAEALYHVEVMGQYACLRDPSNCDGPMLIEVQTEDAAQLVAAVGALTDVAGTLLDGDRRAVGKVAEYENLKEMFLAGMAAMYKEQDARAAKAAAQAKKDMAAWEKKNKKKNKNWEPPPAMIAECISPV